MKKASNTTIAGIAAQEKELRNVALPPYPLVDPVATGLNIQQLQQERNLEVADLEVYFRLSEQSIYNWRNGKNLPSAEHFAVLSYLFDVDARDIWVLKDSAGNIITRKAETVA